MSIDLNANPSIRFADVSFAWPDGTPVLERTTTDFGSHATGLVGDNGTGKTTLLRLITRELTPTTGTVITAGEVGCLPQHLTLTTDARVVDLLGVGQRFDALRAIESGIVDQRLYDLIGDDWDLESRCTATLASLGLENLALDRRVATLSGGETMITALAGLRLAQTPIVLLDEPTNNLDLPAREQFLNAIGSWRGALLVVSHDVALLDRMQTTVELRHATLTRYGGGYADFVAAVEQEQAAARQALRGAEQDLKREQRQRQEAETRLARRQRYARTDHENKRKPKIVMNTRRFQAQVSAGRLRANLDDRVDDARHSVARHESRIRDDDRVRITLPDPGVPASRGIAELHHPDWGVHHLIGPEHVALTGPNGIGKTRLLATLFDADLRDRQAAFAIPRTDRIGYLPQRLDGLDEQASALDNVRAAAPGTLPREVRAQLARFLLPAEHIDRPVATLSGGERFRVALARLLLADPAHQLLVLDEPTNNLDLTTRQALLDALSGYRGALLVVSHDEDFLHQLGIDTWLRMESLASCP